MFYLVMEGGSLQGLATLAALAGAAKLRAMVNARAGLQYLYSSNHHSNYANMHGVQGQYTHDVFLKFIVECLQH
jgi:hypothetical protein